MITPDIEAPHVRDFSERLCDSPLYYIRVNPPGGSEENRCERNVLAVVRKFGGKAIYGWHVSEWPGVYISGRHHVVWRSPDGQMIDATPHGMGFHHIAFIDDARNEKFPSTVIEKSARGDRRLIESRSGTELKILRVAEQADEVFKAGQHFGLAAQRTKTRWTNDGGNAGADAFDGFGAKARLFDEDAWGEIFGHGNSCGEVRWV